MKHIFFKQKERESKLGVTINQTVTKETRVKRRGGGGGGSEITKI